MKIILSQNEIEEAIETYIQKSMTIPEGKEFVIDVSSSRGVGITAEISIQNKEVEAKKFEPIKEVVQEPVKELPVEEVKEEEPKPVKKSFFANLQ